MLKHLSLKSIQNIIMPAPIARAYTKHRLMLLLLSYSRACRSDRTITCSTAHRMLSLLSTSTYLRFAHIIHYLCLPIEPPEFRLTLLKKSALSVVWNLVFHYVKLRAGGTSHHR